VSICDSSSLNSSQNEKYFRQVVQKIKTHFVFSNRFSENRAVCEIVWQNVVQSDRRQWTVQCGACGTVRQATVDSTIRRMWYSQTGDSGQYDTAHVVQSDRRQWTVQYGACGTVRQETVDSTTRRMCIACWMTKARIQTYIQNLLQLLLFRFNNGYANAPEW